jgi:hypothetical protein
MQKMKDIVNQQLSTEEYRERMSLSSTMSDHDHEEYDSPAWKETKESGFVLFLEQLNSIQFELPM